MVLSARNRRRKRDQHAVGFPGDVTLEAADDLSLALALRGAPRETYSSCVRRSRLIRARQIMYSALGSDLTLRCELRCCRRFGRSTSSTSIPSAFKWRASLRPRSCWYLLSQRTSRGQSPQPSGGASRNPSRSLARSTRPGFSAQTVHGHSRVEVEVCVHAQDHLDLGLRLFGADRRHVRAAPFDVALSSTRGAGENGRYCAVRSHVTGKLL
jgi:hypothetical protein